MLIRKFSIGIGLSLGLVACTRTALSTARDAAVEANPVSDVSPAPDVVLAGPDTPPPVADAAVLVPDAAVVAPDVAVAVPDAAVVAPDVAVLVSDAAIPVPDAAHDTANVRRDGTVLPADSREAAANPFANQVFQIDTQHPAPTPDPACTQFEDVDTYRLTFGADTSTLNGLAVRGSAATRFHATVGPESDRLTYHIEDFLAGGRVFIELDQGVYVGEVIMYGSGVPIVRCLRGVLSPQP
jgi:hypothetical protein